MVGDFLESLDVQRECGDIDPLELDMQREVVKRWCMIANGVFSERQVI